jgi:1,4-alpha-glucan branching enzyme
MRAYLIGDFNNWDRDATPMTKNDFGVFEVTIPGKDGQPTIPHDSKIKVFLPGLEVIQRADSIPARSLLSFPTTVPARSVCPRGSLESPKT